MRKNRIILWVAAVLVLLAVSLLWMERAEAPVRYSVSLIAPDGSVRTLPVEVADGDAERSRGLMFRDSLPAGEGMLFIFGESRPLSFWMKNTRIPLDILYFDGQGAFVSRTTMDPCTEDPCPMYPSAGPAVYAVEVNRQEPVAAEVGMGWTLAELKEGQ